MLKETQHSASPWPGQRAFRLAQASASAPPPHMYLGRQERVGQGPGQQGLKTLARGAGRPARGAGPRGRGVLDQAMREGGATVRTAPGPTASSHLPSPEGPLGSRAGKPHAPCVGRLLYPGLYQVKKGREIKLIRHALPLLSVQRDGKEVVSVQRVAALMGT